MAGVALRPRGSQVQGHKAHKAGTGRCVFFHLCPPGKKGIKEGGKGGRSQEEYVQGQGKGARQRAVARVSTNLKVGREGKAKVGNGTREGRWG